MATTEERMETLEKRVRRQRRWIKALGWALVVMFFVGSWMLNQADQRLIDAGNKQLQALRLLEVQHLPNKQP